MTTWFVVNTHPNAEGKASQNLLQQGFDVFAPSFLRRRRHARRTDWVPSPLFPGYIFVRFDPLVARWRSVMSTVGVRRLICRGELPASVPEGVIDDILARRDERGWIVMSDPSSFKRGDRVQVTDGVFSDAIGLFDAVSDRNRIFVLLELLGRTVRVRLPADVVTACAA